MDTPAVEAFIQAAGEGQAAHSHALADALQAAVAAQVAGGLDGLQALPVMGGFQGAVALDPAQATAMGHVGQAAATMHMLGSDVGRGSRPGNSKASRTGPQFCQVDGCGACLDNLKEYHQRYKVCEEHLKMPYIIRDGQQVRFCQQCGRFQPLADFDGAKRSCRVRLQRHNARRRKRPRDSDGAGSTDLAAFEAAAASAAAAVEMAKLAAFVPPPMPIAPKEMQDMQDALQFASATLMHAGQTPPKHPGEEGGEAAEGSEGGEGGGEGEAGGAGNMAPSSMPFVPTVDVMMLLLKGYAAMFHYVLEGATIRPLAPPSELPEQQAAAAAGLGGVPDPLQMTQLMQAQGFLAGALPLMVPGSEMAAALLGMDGPEAAPAAGCTADAQEEGRDAAQGEEGAAHEQQPGAEGAGTGSTLTAEQLAATDPAARQEQQAAKGASAGGAAEQGGT